MGYHLVPKSVTLNDLERRNGRVVCVAEIASFLDLLRKSGWRYTDTFSEWNVAQRIMFLTIYSSQGITPSEGVKVKRSPVAGKIWHIISHNLETVQDRR